MDRSLVTTKATKHGQTTLSRSYNDLNIDQELRAPKASSLAPDFGNAREKCASLPDIALPKISPETRRDERLVPGQSASVLPRLNLITTDHWQIKTSTPKRPQSCTARVRSASALPRTPELLARNRMPRPSLPVAVEIGKIQSAPSSPILSRKPPSVSKASSFTSPKSLVEETAFLADFRRKSYDTGLVTSSTPPVSPALLRKFENSEKTARKAKNLIDDYKRSSPIQHGGSM
ncbi:hypothetical protein ACROYT_G031566 [Oculina patagonica]